MRLRMLNTRAVRPVYLFSSLNFFVEPFAQASISVARRGVLVGLSPYIWGDEHVSESCDFVLWRLSCGLIKMIRRAKTRATPKVIRKAINIDIKLIGFSSLL